MAIGIGIGIPFKRGGISFSSYWTQQLNFYELWKVTGAGTMVGLIKGDSLTITGSGLNAIYAVPDNATYKALDTDYVFHKSNGDVSTLCDGNRLIGYDFPRIIVKYLNVSPYTIDYIGILDTGQSVNNKMRDDFDLSVWWDNVLSAHGNIKGNRGVGQNVWTAESVFDAASTALFARMLTADGVAQTDARKTAIDTLIKALKGDNTTSTNFWDKFDRFIAYRAKGNGSRMLNWKADEFNAAAVANGGTLTQTDDVGCHGDGIKSYIRSNYIPSSDATQFTLNDACYGIKISGTVTDGINRGMGASDGTRFAMLFDGLGLTNYHRLNSADYINVLDVIVGYNNLSRANATQIKYHQTGRSEVVTAANSSGVVTRELYSLAYNDNGTPNYFMGSGIYIEFEWQGSAITSTEFGTLETILNAYIAAL